jgi:hypothetical protein
VDPDTHCLVYGGCVGYKTSLESIRATLITGKPLSLNEQMAQPVDRYEVVWQAMPEYTSHHACFMNRLALSSKWEPEDEVAYLLVFQDSITGITESTHLFVERLMEILEVPVLEEWAEALWKAALQYRFISEIETAGDCVFGVKLDLKADWKGLIEKLLQEGELQLA